MQRLLEDLRFALRGLRRTPMFAAVAILSLGVSIGGVTTMFRVIDALDLRGLPYPDAHRLASVAWRYGTKSIFPGYLGGIQAPAFFSLRERARAYESLQGFSYRPKLRTVGDRVETINAYAVTTGFFSLLGATPVIGRGFLDSDTAAGATPVVILSCGYWEKEFGGDTSVLGKRIDLAEEFSMAGSTPPSVSYVIVGVTGPKFHPTGGLNLDMWGVLQGRRDTLNALTVVGRLREGTTLVAARSEAARLSASLPGGKAPPDVTLGVVPFRDALARPDLPSRNRFLLFAVAAFVLLLAIINVVNLVLARAKVRHVELGVRRALGATRARLLQLGVVEALCITLPASLLAIWVGSLGGALAMRKLELDSLDLRPNPGDSVAFAMVLGVLVALLVGSIPALTAGQGSRTPILSSGGDRTVARSSGRTQRALVGLEVALSVALLAGAGLLGKTLLYTLEQDVGEDARHLVNVIPYDDKALAAPGAPETKLPIVLARFRAVPGVDAVTAWAIDRNPRMRVEGHPALPPLMQPAGMDVLPDFFSVYGIPLLRGRLLLTTDGPGSEPVSVVTENAARALWGTLDVLGKRVAFAPTDSTKPWSWATVVGVVHNAGLLIDPEGHAAGVAFRPFAQGAADGLLLAVRLSGTRPPTMDQLRHVVRDLRGRPVGDRDIHPFDTFLYQMVIERPQFNAYATGAFALFGLFLASLGIYGMVAFTVARRTREMGIRLALGANAAHVIRTATGPTALAALVGLAAGLIASAGLTRVLRAMLHGVSPLDPSVFLGAATVILLATATASYVPALRATRIDPVDALRAE